MNDFLKGYFKDYSKYYILMNGVPTSPFGVTLAKKCKWCHCVMYPKIPERNTEKNDDYVKPNKKTSVMKQVFCSKDCQDDYGDFSYFKRLRYQKERMQKFYAEKKNKY